MITLSTKQVTIAAATLILGLAGYAVMMSQLNSPNVGAASDIKDSVACIVPDDVKTSSRATNTSDSSDTHKKHVHKTSHRTIKKTVVKKQFVNVSDNLNDNHVLNNFLNNNDISVLNDTVDVVGNTVDVDVQDVLNPVTSVLSTVEL